jgi:hypothetical protein
MGRMKVWISAMLGLGLGLGLGIASPLPLDAPADAPLLAVVKRKVKKPPKPTKATAGREKLRALQPEDLFPPDKRTG